MTRARWLILLALTLVAQPMRAAGAPQSSAPLLLSTEPTPPAGANAVPAQMSGQPLQVGDLPPGVVAIRVIRRSFGENITAHPVQLRVGETGRVVESMTDAAGRAQFQELHIGETVQAMTSVDGEALDSRPFALPSEGGVRVLLVAGVGAGAVASLAPLPAEAAPSNVRRQARSGPSPWPEQVSDTSVALTLFGIAGAAVMWSWRARRPAAAVSRAAQRIGRGHPPTSERRAAAFELLVRLETDHQGGHVAGNLYALRRSELMAELIALDAQLAREARDASGPEAPANDHACARS